MGGNVGDDKGWDDNVISTPMEARSGDIGNGKYVYVYGGMEGDA